MCSAPCSTIRRRNRKLECYSVRNAISGSIRQSAARVSQAAQTLYSSPSVGSLLSVTPFNCKSQDTKVTRRSPAALANKEAQPVNRYAWSGSGPLDRRSAFRNRPLLRTRAFEHRFRHRLGFQRVAEIGTHAFAFLQTLQEISQKTGYSFPSVRNHVYRGVEQLRNRLSETGFEIRRD